MVSWREGRRDGGEGDLLTSLAASWNGSGRAGACGKYDWYAGSKLLPPSTLPLHLSLHRSGPVGQGRTPLSLPGTLRGKNPHFSCCHRRMSSMLRIPILPWSEVTMAMWAWPGTGQWGGVLRLPCSGVISAPMDAGWVAWAN